MKKINGKQMSEILSISPQAVNGLTTRGRLVRDNSGMYDLSNKENRSFLKERNIDIKKISIPETPAPGRPVANRSQGKIKTVISGIEKSGAELTRELTQKKIEKLNFEMEVKKKKYLPTDFIENQLVSYIAKLNSNIERTAATSIKDMGKKILDAGEVNSAMITEWTNLFLALCHNTKIQVLNEIKNFNPQENKIKI